ncbi:MAG: ATP-dependent Clp protease ATP-binding subunit [Planctomycetia bacterium]|nr:ATP-dependent Clp protease ATP-binding subunit [Planctomycetia bacterium]
MIRMEPNVVLRYSSLLDEFVKIRSFAAAEVEELLRFARIPDRNAYRALVLNACVVGYPAHAQDAEQRVPGGRRALDEELGKLCIAVNPSLDIAHVTLPALPEAKTGLHLLKAPEPEPAEERARVAKLEERLAERVIGQRDAVHAVAQVVRRAAAGLRDTARPLGTFFFIGQTGVGKTELAKALTDVVFEDRTRMVRVDCSEYGLPHEYAKLIGAPPGYIGHSEGGFLTEEMKKKGKAVVLFDEIEKADAKVHNLLLQLFDEGFITDSHGTRVSFADAIVILTSNVGVEEVRQARDAIGFDRAKRAALDREALFGCTVEALKREFRPEFLNRIDEVVLFNALGLDDCIRIVERFLGDVVQHATRADLRLSWTPHVPRFLAESGFSPEYGARELRRTVQDLVENPLADRILDGEFRRGDHVQLTVKRGQIAFRN